MGKYDHLSRNELQRLLEARDRRDATRFGLVWEASEIERDRALNSDFVALDLDPELSVSGEPWNNLIIEGDNFDALRHLRMTYAGQVKCIYIDPPYNTGNRDFVYNDRFVDANDAWRHSTWVEFMWQRLTLAKDLLRQDGVIFVSIDDNEVASLRLLMNRVFGENNFVASCIWQKRYASSNDHKTIAPMHEYVLVYQMSDLWRRNLLPRTADKDDMYRFNDEKGIFRCSDYTCPKSAEERPNLYYPIIQPKTGKRIWPKKTRVWAYSEEEHFRNADNGLIYWGKDGNGKTPSFKRYKHMLRNADGVVPTTWWTFDDVGHNDTAKKEILTILAEDARSFSTPKPVALIERILRIATVSGDLVLDFFAGSGTTAHAVLKLNAENQGQRRFILVSNTESTVSEPDKNLCRDVCARRVRRVIEGYGDTPGLGGNFAYLRCRRIKSGRLVNIEHAQVWHSLQFMHHNQLSPYAADGGLAWAQIGGVALVYVPRFTTRILPALRKVLKNCDSALIYSWQTALLCCHIRTRKAAHEPIPESLARKFGLTGTVDLPRKKTQT
ncbi:MAG: site-specific DNA-methyltransferase [Verrucomicrobiales bacterium]|jgi:adenine-specific DNA-methyltransferase|nr:site-specific DNA-methyltransferase [Verrucomicrobiales bacterium]